DDVAVLLRPAGTDAVEDLRTGQRAAGQAEDASRRSAAGSKTLVLLHPDPDRVEAIRGILTTLGAEQIEYAPETIYTGAQSEAEAAAASEVSPQEVHAQLTADEQRAAAPAQHDQHKKDQPL